MNKQEFLTQLKDALSSLAQEDTLNFYSEMIDDLMEDGLSEEEAVAEIGTIDAIVSQIVADTPLPQLIKEKIKPQHPLRKWEIMLLVLGFPVWFPLLIAAFAVLLSLAVALWAVVLSLWAVAVALAISSLGGIGSGILSICRGNGAQGILLIGAGLLLAGLSIFLFFGCKAVTRGAAVSMRSMKSLFFRKENTK